MQPYHPTIIWRHRRENVKKCSLRGLEVRKDLCFYTYPTSPLPNIDGYILLTLEAPRLTSKDAHGGLFVIDATWRYAEKMFRALGNPSKMLMRSLPPDIMTAYPRRQYDCPDPTRGLASVEALYVAYTIMGRDTTGLLDHYTWKDRFLSFNNGFSNIDF